MANGNGFDWSGLFDGVDFGKTASDLASAYQTKQQIGQTDRAYNDAKNLILNPSADQQKYRTQLAQLMDNPGSMESSPLYQSMLDQGMNAVNRTAAAKGQLGSGNRLADLMSAGQKTAANYYFPQQQALASLSGITGDSGQRALGAQSLIAGNNANVSQNRAMLSDLFSGLGVANQQQQMIDAISGRNGGQGGQGGGLINNAVGAVKNWFGGSSDWTPGDYQGFNNSIDPSMANWGDQISSWGDGSTNWFGGGGTGGASFNDMTAPINSAPSLYDFNSWKLY